ncbi:hypothetical protein Q765_00635 [Flavobacterium rivuli WB 3.3-2 = DSM 21788]|uniref:CAAX prenyl protease 2/Lysostaphin resistance protein A-like domain-containing protein n=1 Tax=Flavobacterium rivuli WB 3.3-2 = DSM 21788 TaxID=1121895 RepID=A0A0A2MJD4_9FLAO|nr:CPBP family intramembrane glutamic endopeptidase [Flavobacterium rivuli]KGO88450.1 hypothetical protein Q765_00635 [Flavobacterium rivuli WB 3.3-2 = DSM 21788]
MILLNKKKKIILDGLLFSIILLFYFTNWIQFPFKLPLCALLIIAVTFLKSKNLHELGFLHKVSLWKTILWASLIVFMATVAILLWTPFLEGLFGKPDYSAYGVLKGNKKLVLQLWFYGMISAAFAEEVLFRGYFCSLLVFYIGTSQLSKAITIVTGALLFTLAHYSQGISGLINIFIISLVFYIVFIRSGRNIYATILAHAIVDTVGLYQIYLGDY